jgi:integrase
MAEGPLLKSVFIPLPLAQASHPEDSDRSYLPYGIYKMIRWATNRLVAGDARADTSDEVAFLAATSPHAFRPTFGTQATANDVPLDVVQSILGQSSLQTTIIYIQAEKQRMLKEAAYFLCKKPRYFEQQSATG